MKYSSRAVLIFICVVSSIVSLTQTGYAQPPANDECSGAFVVTSVPYSNSQDTRLATPNVTDPILLCADSGKGKTVWYTFTADSTRLLRFTTTLSSPTDYDPAMAIYTGTCGALVEMDCNDDINPGTNRKAEIYFEVQAGTTYIIHIAEWNGGGPSGGTPTGGDLVFQVTDDPPPPIVKGPKFGSVPNGAMATTAAFELSAVPSVPEKLSYINNKFSIPKLPAPNDVMPPLAPKGSNYKEDRHFLESQLAAAAKPVVLENFEANTPTGSIPPDPIVAVGPNHVMGLVNSSFRIWDKSGNLMEDISLDTWFSNIVTPVGFADPQVHYDHNVNRWFMSGGGFAAPYHILISVSDDDDPNGTWYNWALPATLGDSVVSPAFLPDYPQVGFDDSSVYVTTRNFGASFYSQVRIIKKSDLLSAGGPVTWTDYWDFREPDHPTVVLDGIRPSFIYGSPGVHFLVNDSPYNPGTFFTVWTISYPLTDSSVTGQNVPVVEYTSLPQAQASQLGAGGGSLLLEVGGSDIRHKAVYRDSSLWMVHPIASGPADQYSALRYVRLNPFTHTNLEDEAMGVDGYWHFYPSLMVDAEKNVIITYSRSGETEYVGAFVAGHKNTDPPGLSSSVVVKAGEAFYDEDFGGGRNRWGDYMGAALDPSDSMAIWVNTEFANSPANTWSTWIAKVKMGPIPGKYIFVDNQSITYDEAEVGLPGDTLSFTMTNNGTDTLTVSAISLPDSHFVLLNPPSLPLKIGTFDIINFDVVVVPEVVGPISGSLVFTSDDALNTTTTVDFIGEGFVIEAAQAGVLYASSGTTDGGRLLTVDPIDASSTPVGPSDYTQLINIRVKPSTNELIGIATTSSSTAAVYDIVRVNSGGGDAHQVSSVPISLLKGMAFRGDTLYVARINGAIYRVDIATGAATLVASTGISISGMDFHPVTGELWASVRGGPNLDRIYKIALPSGVPTLVGATGLGVQTVDIAFDDNGNLFGLIGTGVTTNNLLLIDTTTGAGGVVGSMGIVTGQGLAIRPGTGFNAALYTLAPRWNMVSVPFVVPDYRKTVIFPTATSHAYEYLPGYQKKDTLDNDAGYWVKFGTQSMKGIVGDPIPNDTMPVHPKWNIIGSRSEEVPVGMLSSDPPGNILTSYFEYGDSGYSIASSIVPGRGYWVKAAADGKIVFNTFSAFSKVPKPAELKEYLAQYNTVLLSDATGLGQMLYIGTAKEGAFDDEQFALPPAPLQGVFGARFASQRMLEKVPAGMKDAADYPVSVSSITSPLKVKWDMSADQSVSYSLVVTSKGSPAVSTYPMGGAGEIVLRQPSISDVTIRASMHTVPEQFVLHQNYPNPFNPQTTIRYGLPVSELVTLKVYDILGREVATLVDQRQDAGYYAIPFNAEELSSGVYFYQLTAGSFTQIHKMMLIR